MGCSRSDSVRGGRDAVVAESGDLDGDGPFKRVARSVALLLIGLTVLRSRDADADALVCGFGEGVGSSMRDREWGGDWVTGEFKTASLTGSNFAGIVDAAGWRTKGGTSGEGAIVRRVARKGRSLEGRVVQPRRGRGVVGRRR